MAVFVSCSCWWCLTESKHEAIESKRQAVRIKKPCCWWIAYRIKKNMLLVVPPRGEKNAKLGKACLASEGTCSIKASASNGTQRKQQSKSFSKFRKGFSKGSCPKEVPQRAAQQGDQPIACTREVDKKFCQSSRQQFHTDFVRSCGRARNSENNKNTQNRRGV